MSLATLDISGFRNLQRLTLRAAPRLNLITGANGAGKTSLLEAIFFLSRGRSFRSRLARDLIHSGAGALRIVAGVDRDGRRFPVGIERSPQQLSARIDGVPVRALSELSAALPVLLLNPDSHRLLEDGPRERRRFMDWGLFHTDAGFLPAWKRYRSALQQRNAALRAAADGRTVEAWDRQLVGAAETLDRLRAAFCNALQSALTAFLPPALAAQSLTIDYRRGWARDASLAELLRRDLAQDRQHGHTRAGPHRADFIVRVQSDGVSPAATERLSRGQQKLLVTALTLVQAQRYRQRHDRDCVLLIDDLPAELDDAHRRWIMTRLAAQPAQLFIAAMEPGTLLDDWPDDGLQRLHLDAGKLSTEPSPRR